MNYVVEDLGSSTLMWWDVVDSFGTVLIIPTMHSEPTLTQNKIAEQAEFINAQSYSWAFRKMIGMPPKEWLSRNIH